MYCGNCNQKLKEGAAFCPNCGRKLIYRTNPSTASAPRQPAKQEKKGTPWLAAVLGAAVGIPLVVVVICLLSRFVPAGVPAIGELLSGIGIAGNGNEMSGGIPGQKPQGQQPPVQSIPTQGAQETPQQHKDRLLVDADALACLGDYLPAFRLLNEAWKDTGDGDYYEAMVAYRRRFGMDNASSVAAGKHNTAAIRSDGTVAVWGDNDFGELTAESWANVIAVGAGDHHIVGLRKDGTVLAAGELEYGQCNVYGWENIVAISAGDFHTVGLAENGFVYATGYNHAGQCDVQDLMYAAQGRRIVALAAGYVHTLALLEDGTVVACGNNETGEGNVSAWKDIVLICAGTEFSAGLKVDGTVVLAGQIAEDWDVSGWTDIVNLAAGDGFLVGVKADGSAVAVGETAKSNPFVNPETAAQWKGIVRIAAGHDHAVALHGGDLLLCVGSNQHDQCGCHGKNLG